ncbi:MAG: hypothetical protein ACREPG_04035 [Candidatus Binatia bacterium]
MLKSWNSQLLGVSREQAEVKVDEAIRATRLHWSWYILYMTVGMLWVWFFTSILWFWFFASIVANT